MLTQPPLQDGSILVRANETAVEVERFVPPAWGGGGGGGWRPRGGGGGGGGGYKPLDLWIWNSCDEVGRR